MSPSAEFVKGKDYTGVCVVYFCHDGQGSYAMVKRGAKSRDEQGTWEFGGGGLRFNETVEDGLKREIKEEFDTKPLEIDFLGFRDVHRMNNGQPTHWIALDYKVKVDRAKVKLAEPEMFEALCWVTIGTLPAPLHSQIPLQLELYKGKL